MFLQKLVGAKGTKAKCEFGDYYTKKLSVLPEVVKELLFEIGLYPDEAEAYFGPMLCSIYPHFKHTEHAELILQLMEESFPDIDRSSLSEVVRLSGASDGRRLRRNSTLTQNVEVHVKVLGGRELVAKDRGGTSDPFVKVGLVYGEEGRMVGKDAQGKTKVVKKTVNPQWDDEFTFNSTGVTYRAMEQLFLRFECWDWNAITSSSYMGHAVVKLTQNKIGETHDLELELKGKKASGTLLVQLRVSAQLGQGIDSDGYQVTIVSGKKSKKKGSALKDRELQARFEEEVRHSERERAIGEAIQQLDNEEDVREFMNKMQRSMRRNTAAVIRRSGSDVPMTQPAVLRRKDGAVDNKPKKACGMKLKDLGDKGAVYDTPPEESPVASASATASATASASPERVDTASSGASDHSHDAIDAPVVGGRERSRAQADIHKIESRDVLRQAAQADDAAAHENEYEQETTRTVISRSAVMKTFETSDPNTLYKDWQKIGQGAFGAVFCATNIETGKKVAFKVCDEPGEKVRSITINETWQLQQCDHPNIISYITGHYFDKKVWLGMEYCDSGTLGDFLKLCPTPSERHLGAIMAQILKGINYLHSTGRLHRDIKPANILLNHNGRIKIADLGLVLSSSDAEAVAGSAYWMAPEIVNLQTYTNKVDIFSIACVAYQMINGEPPNAKYHPIKAKFRMGTRGLPELSASGCSSELKNFIDLAGSHNASDRPTAAELLEHAFITKKCADRKELASLFHSTLAGDSLIGL